MQAGGMLGEEVGGGGAAGANSAGPVTPPSTFLLWSPFCFLSTGHFQRLSGVSTVPLNKRDHVKGHNFNHNAVLQSRYHQC